MLTLLWLTYLDFKVPVAKAVTVCRFAVENANTAHRILCLVVVIDGLERRARRREMSKTRRLCEPEKKWPCARKCAR